MFCIVIHIIIILFHNEQANDEENKNDKYDFSTSTITEDIEYCQEVAKELIEYLDTHDVDGLKSMFASYYVENEEELDEQIKLLMDVYCDEITSYEQIRVESDSYSVDHGYYHYKINCVEIENIVTNSTYSFDIEFIIKIADREDDQEELGIIRIFSLIVHQKNLYSLLISYEYVYKYRRKLLSCHFIRRTG